MRAAYVGLDLAKNVFQVHAADRSGCEIHNRKLSRSQVAKYFSSLPAVTVGMEASASAHHWARKLQKFGHRVRLMAPIFVQPFRKSGKNDANDAEAICEAVQRPSMRFVAGKDGGAAIHFSLASIEAATDAQSSGADKSNPWVALGVWSDHAAGTEPTSGKVTGDP